MKPLLVCSWYRAPDLNVEIFDHFEKFLQKIEYENKDMILAGDLNCNLLSTETNITTKKLKDLMHNYQLKQHITASTRITSNTQSLSLIDIIITKMDDIKSIDSGVIHLGISDHSLVYICRKNCQSKRNPQINTN